MGGGGAGVHTRSMDFPALLRHQDLVQLGISQRRLAVAIREGMMVRVRPGVFVRGADWTGATPEMRAMARAHALSQVSRVPPVFSHASAAAAHGLPLYRPDQDRVHVIAPTERPGAAGGVVRHRGDLTDDGIVEIVGLRVTSLTRTVADVARTATFEQAVTIADAALRREFVTGPGKYDGDGAERFRQQVMDTVRLSPHGQTRARRVVDFADGRAQLPGESISRIRLHQLGFGRVDLQVAVAGPRGRTYYVDFGLEEIGAFGEFDGAMKYTDGRFLNGRTSAEALDEEKQREDWIRGSTQRRYVRWGWPHLATTAELGARLAAFGIHPPS